MNDEAHGTSLVAIPQRTSLVTQTVEILRQDLRNGVWQQYLPGEHSLCKRLQISRPTLRAALEWLQREGWIEVSQGRRRRISSPRKPTTSPAATRVVGILAALPYHTLSSFSLFTISELQRHLTSAGYRVEVHANPGFSLHPLKTGLRNLISETRADCWIVFGNARGALRWLYQKQARALVLGAYSAEDRFPAVGVDLEGTARHAVGMFLRRGHSRIALFVASDPADNSHPIERGFRRGFADFAARIDASPAVIHHDGTVRGIRDTLDAVFRTKTTPTGLLVVRPQHLLTTMGHLMSSGIRIPRDVSLIGMGHDPSLDHVVPSVAHYQIDWNEFDHRLRRQALQLAKTGKVTARQVSVMCDFHDGDTLAACVVEHRL